MKKQLARIGLIAVIATAGSALAQDVVGPLDATGVLGLRQTDGAAVMINLNSTVRQYSQLTMVVQFDSDILTIANAATDVTAVGRGATYQQQSFIPVGNNQLNVTFANFTGAGVPLGNAPILRINFTVPGNAPLGTRTNGVRLSVISAAPTASNLTADNADITIVSYGVTGVPQGDDNQTDEFGDTAVFDVTLNTQPQQTVTVAVSSSDESEGTVAPTSLTFTPGNWNVAQQVTATGQDDAVVDGDQPYNVVFETASGDDNYNNLQDTAAAVNVDNEPVRFTLGGTQATVAGGNISVTITAIDQDGATATAYTGSHALTFGGASAAPDGTNPTVNSVAFGSATTISFSAGVATLDVDLVAAEMATLTASDATLGISTTSNDSDGTLDVNVSPAADAALLYVAAPQSPVTAGATWTTITVQIVDAFENPTPSTANVTLNVSGPGSTSPSVAAVNGLATFDSVVTTVAGSYSVQATNSVTPTNSVGVTVSPDALENYLVSNPGERTAGVPFTVTITARDQFNNTITSAAEDETVTLSLGTADNTQTNVPVTITNGSGSANLTLTTAVDGQTINVAGAAASGSSGTFDVVPNAIDHYAVAGGGGTETAGVPVTITARARDAFMNFITDGPDATEVLDLSVLTPDGGLAPLTATTVNGVAAIEVTLTLATSGQKVTVTGQDSGAAGTSAAIDVDPAAADHLAYLVQPTYTQATDVALPAFTVAIQDEFNNQTADTFTVDLTLNDLDGDDGVGAFSGESTTSAAATNGQVIFDNVAIDTCGQYTITATSESLPDGGVTSATVPICNQPPEILAVSPATEGDITMPQDPAAIDELESTSFSITATDDNDPSELGAMDRIEWYVNDVLQPNPARAQLQSSFTFQTTQDTIANIEGHRPTSDVFVVRATAYDTQGGDTDVVWNVTVNDVDREATAPVISITPSPAMTEDDLTANIVTPGSDADGDTIEGYDFVWSAQEAIRSAFPGDVQDNFDTVKGDTWTVTVRPITNPYGTGDVLGASVQASVDIINTPATADAQNVGVTEDTNKAITLTGTDPDVGEGVDDLTFAIAGNPTKGTLTGFNADTGDVTYVPNLNETGNDAFTFTVNDGSGASAAAMVDLVIAAVNDPPDADDQSINVKANTPDVEAKESVDFSLTASDVDDDDSILTFQVKSLPLDPDSGGSAGTLKKQDGTLVVIDEVLTGDDFPLTFEPADDVRGATSFLFTASDDEPSESLAATVQIVIGTPPWYPFISFVDATHPNGGGIYRVIIRDDSDTEVLNAQITDPSGSGEDGEVVFQPENYQGGTGSGRNGLLPGIYTWAYQIFDQAIEEFGPEIPGDTIEVSYDPPALPVDLMTAAIATSRSGPVSDSRNWRFTFTPDWAQGFVIEVVNEQTATNIWRTVTFMRAGPEDAIPLNQSTTYDIFIAEAGQYYWRVAGFNPLVPANSNSLLFTALQPFEIAGADPTATPPGIPQGLIPDGRQFDAVGLAANVDLTWQLVPGATSYKVLVVSTAGTTIVNRATATTTQWGAVVPPGIYNWSVRAVNAFGQSAYATARRFTVVADTTSGLPGVASPTVTVESDAVTIDWSWSGNVGAAIQMALINSNDGTTQEFKPSLGNQLDPLQVVFDVGEAGSAAPLLPGTTYQYRVRGLNAANLAGSWSGLFSFTTQGTSDSVALGNVVVQPNTPVDDSTRFILPPGTTATRMQLWTMRETTVASEAVLEAPVVFVRDVIVGTSDIYLDVIGDLSNGPATYYFRLRPVDAGGVPIGGLGILFGEYDAPAAP